MLYRGLGSVFIGLLLSLSLLQNIEAAITAVFESPADGQPVAGIGTVQGFTFSDTGGVTITEVALAVDGTFVSTIPCCSERGDVAAAFSDLPAENTLNSGFGITQNFNLTSPGEHDLTLTITDSSGAQVTRTHTVTVIQPGGFEFLDHVDLSEASAERQGQDLVLSNVRIRDAASQQAVVINARLRWFRNRQGLGLVEATTVGAASTIKTARPWLTGLRKAKTSAASLVPLASVENPGNGDTVAGAALIQGFAFARAGRSITRVQLFIDGAPFFNIPCCSDRADVAAAFSDEPNALNSGFGVTFNYGLLSSGVHQLMVEIEDSEGDIRKIVKGILVKRPGEFEFLEDLDISAANARIANGCLIIEGAVARDVATGQTATRLLRYRFLSSLQAFQLLEEYIDEVLVSNFFTVINGDTSSVAALKADDGGDGISFPEATAAVNNTAEGERILISFVGSGTIQFDPSVPIQIVQRAKVTIDGDVDGDGAPDVTLEGVGMAVAAEAATQAQTEETDGLVVAASNVTLRGLVVKALGGDAVEIRAAPGTVVSDVALLGLEVAAEPSGEGIALRTQATPSQEAHMDAVLLRGSRISGGNESILIRPTGAGSGAEALTVQGITIADNEISEGGSCVAVGPREAMRASLTQIVITNNTLRDSGSTSIVLEGGISASGNNLVEALVTDNIVINAGSAGIALEGGAFSSGNNTVQGELRHNQIQASASPGIFLRGGFDGTAANLVEALVADNIVTMTGLSGIWLLGGSASTNNRLIGEIRGNQVQGTTENGIFLLGGVDGAADNILEVLVTDNEVTMAGLSGIRLQGGADGAADNMLIGEIMRNQVQDTTQSGIFLLGGVDGAADNILEVMVADNEVTMTGSSGILMEGGIDVASRNNMLIGEIMRNQVRGTTQSGIGLIGGFNGATDNILEVMVADNEVSLTELSGIVMEGGSASRNNMLIGEIMRNQVQNTPQNGIFLTGGFNEAADNILEVMVADNEVTRTRISGISIVGGIGSRRNNIMGEVRGNMVRESIFDGILLIGGWFASENQVDMITVENEVINSGRDGIYTAGGTSRFREEGIVIDNTLRDSGGTVAKGNEGPALDNVITGMIVGNQTQGNAGTDIAVFGGFDNFGGEVVGNLARQDITSNIADSIICEDGIVGNTAECTFNDNMSPVGIFARQGNRPEQRSLAKGFPVSPALAQHLSVHMERLALKEQQIRQRAETITDERLRKRLYRLYDRLAALQDKLAARMAGKSPYLLDR